MKKAFILVLFILMTISLPTKADICDGYGFTKCPTGYAISDTCLNGKKKYYKCENCAKGYQKDGDKCVKTLTCKNGGAQEHEVCICPEGWTGTTCQTAAKCPYKTTSCANGFHPTGNTCKTGKKTVIECEADACEGFEYTKCQKGYKAVATEMCLSGKTKKYKCETCAKGYHKDGDKCVKTLTCKNGGVQEHEVCVCPEGWMGTTCQTAVKCPYSTTSCAKGFHETGNTCKSGNKLYKECIQTLECQNGGMQEGTRCVCPAGWTGVLCQSKIDCSAYQTSCGAGYDATQSCLSGTTPYYTCTPKVVPEGYTAEPCGIGYIQKDAIVSGTTTYYKCEKTDCSAYQPSCGEGYDATQSCLSGTTPYYTCTPKLVPDGYTTTKCGSGYTQIGTFLSGTTTYYKCEKTDCSAYQPSCGEGYDATQSCLSGTTPYYTCTPKEIPAGYQADPCYQWGEGYTEVGYFISGDETYYKCEPNDCSSYQESCDEGYNAIESCLSGHTPYYTCTPKDVPAGYTATACGEGYNQIDSILSGTTTYYKCEPKNCSGYQASCGTGYDATQSCLSGTTPYYTCTPKVVPEGYTTTKCGSGYTQIGTFLSGTTTYYKCEKTDCSAYQTSCGEGYNKVQSCLSGTTQYYTCTPKTVPSGYTATACGEGYNQVDSMLSGTTTYYKCEAKSCSGYYASCGAGYDATQSCLSGTKPYYTCTPKVVPDGYTTTKCGSGYTQIGTFLSGTTTYYKCEKTNCSAYQTSCGEGYNKIQSCLSGTTPYYTCTPKEVPAGYTATKCAFGYVQVDSMISGTTTYYLCEEADCSAFQIGCDAGYDATESCMSGTTPYYTCTPKEVPEGYTTERCGSGYDQTEFLSGTTKYYKCEKTDCSAYQASCSEGYNKTLSCLSGTTPYYTCTPKDVPEGYTPTACGEGYNQLDSMLSGTTTYYLCEAKDCSAYQPSCGEGYDATQSCLSGTTPYYTCTPKEVPAGYTTERCNAGYDQTEFLSGTTTYYKCEATDCSAYQVSCGEGYNATQSCLSATTPYYTCTPKDVPEGYTSTACGEGYNQIDSMLSGTTTYYLCEEKGCDGFELNQQPNHCADVQTCMKGENLKYHCNACQTGWAGSTCSDAAEGYIKIGNEVFVDLGCVAGHGHQVGNACVCEVGWEGTTCDTLRTASNSGTITTLGASTTTYGMKEDEYYNLVNETTGNISISTTSGDAVGMYAQTCPVEDARSTATNQGTISVSSSQGNSYGLYGEDNTSVVNDTGAQITARSSSGTAYGIYGASNTVVLNNVGANLIVNGGGADTFAYGLYGGIGSEVTNAVGANITMSGSGKLYGLYGAANTINQGHIGISGSTKPMYGIYGISGSNITNEGSGVVEITLPQSSTSVAYGMYGENNATILNDAGGNITINQSGNSSYFGTGYGIYGQSGASITNGVGGNIRVYGESDSTLKGYGIYADKRATVTNYGTVTAPAYGIYGNEYSNITNSSSGNITSYQYGIYGATGSQINNQGQISGIAYNYSATNSYLISKPVYGFYASAATVTNSGTVNIETDSDAYGVYATAGSDITNEVDGKIMLSNKDVYHNSCCHKELKQYIGIYGEPGVNISNLGLINIDLSYAELSNYTYLITNYPVVGINSATATNDGKIELSLYIDGITHFRPAVNVNSDDIILSIKGMSGVNITNQQNGSIDINNSGVSIKKKVNVLGLEGSQNITNYGKITLNNATSITGILGTSIEAVVTNAISGKINITGSGDKYGIMGYRTTENKGVIELSNSGSYSSYGIYADVLDNDLRSEGINSGKITITNTGTGAGAKSYGMYQTSGLQLTNATGGKISISGRGSAYGMHGKKLTNEQGAEINISGATGAYGMSAGGIVANYGNITVSSSSGYGIYSTGSNVTNANGAVITMSGNSVATGIYGASSTNINNATGAQIILNENSGKTTGISGNGTNSGIISLSDNTGTEMYGMKGSSITNASGGQILFLGNENTSIGMYGSTSVINATDATISMTQNANAYGITGSNITNQGAIEISESNNFAIGIKPTTKGINATGGSITLTGNRQVSKGMASDTDTQNLINSAGANITITQGLVSTYGIEGIGNTSVTNSGTITLSQNKGTIYGISGTNSATLNNMTNASIVIDENNNSNNSEANVYGMATADTATANNYGTLTFSQNKAKLYGMYNSGSAGITNGANANISISHNDGTSYGMAVEGTSNGTATNQGTISISDNQNTAYGMYANAGGTIINSASGNIEIDNGGTVYGMYAVNGTSAAKTKVSNAGNITITNSTNAYGIYAGGVNVIVANTGTISLNGSSCTGADCVDTGNNSIVLNGATFSQNGSLQATSVNLNSFGGIVLASTSSKFDIAEDISGDLTMSADAVSNGFDTTYTIKDMIQAEDVSGLNLISQSALFEATLENDTDAVMTMKSFDSVVKNSSVAEFLQNNYAAQNNENLFATLKSIETVAQLNKNINDIFGKDMFTRMAFEDLTMIRELNFDMNNHLFGQEEGYFEFGGNVSPSQYDGNLGSIGRYSLNGYNDGKRSFALGIAISDVNTNDGHSRNSRFDRSFMISTPYGYRTNSGFELITAPKVGYTNGTYNRTGFNGMTYDGKIEKNIYALMNEARYPLEFGKVMLTPKAEFNVIGYNIKGSEDNQKYSLKIKSQNHYSVEAGFGLDADKEFAPFKDTKIKLSGGVAVYHEFANPYELEVGMTGMSGSYKLRDEKRGDNRTVARFGFDYNLGDDVEISAGLLSNIDHEYRYDASIDFKYNF